MNQLCSDLSMYQIDENPFGNDGNGEFNANYKARNRRKQKDCVIKKIKSDLIKTNDERNLLMREISVQASFHHIAILELLGYSIPFKDQKDYAIVTPFMPNGDLNNLIKQVSIGNIPDNWETIKSINMVGIAAGMAYMHQHNFIHQYLKPEHIVLDENNYPKIIGYHCSRLYKGEKLALPINMLIYMAPEMLDSADYTNKVDVFSYGMLIYYMLTLETPWSHIEGINSDKLYELVSEGKMPEIQHKDIPNCYKELIEKCWSKDPNDRPSFIHIVNMLIENKEDFFDPILVNEEELDEYIECIK